MDILEREATENVFEKFCNLKFRTSLLLVKVRELWRIGLTWGLSCGFQMLFRNFGIKFGIRHANLGS